MWRPFLAALLGSTIATIATDLAITEWARWRVRRLMRAPATMRHDLFPDPFEPQEPDAPPDDEEIIGSDGRRFVRRRWGRIR